MTVSLDVFGDFWRLLNLKNFMNSMEKMKYVLHRKDEVL